MFGIVRAYWVNIYRSAWAGFTLLILIWGQCESLNVGIGTEELYSHVFFCSLFIRDDSIFRMLMRVTTSKGRSWPGVGLCPLQTMMDFSSH